MEKRLLSVQEGAAYVGLKRTKFRTWAADNGALVKIGSRALYDKRVIDSVLNARGAAANEK